MDQTDKKDLRGFTFIRNQIVHGGVTPSLREIANAVGYTSRHSATKMLYRLEARGLIKRTDRGIRLSGKAPSMSEQTVDVPLVGAVACGLPTLAEQEPEALIPVSTRLARPGGHTYFLLRARGTSMNKSGIKDGDLVLIKQQSSADPGEKVVALINDDATIKHYHPQKGSIILKPNSTDARHKPIVLSEDFVIQGIVSAVLPANTY